MDWRDLPATKEFFKELRDGFRDIDEAWYTSTEERHIWRLRGRKDVFLAIERILGERTED